MSETSGTGLRITVTRGGDPGDDVLVALAAVLTRPVAVAPAPEEDADEVTAGQSNWVRAARLEAVVHGRRISTVADLTWRR